MTPTPEEIAARLDRDRREREDELLYLLLLLFGAKRGGRGTVYGDVLSAVHFGIDPFAAATDVLLGNPARGLPGLPDQLAVAMLYASYAGWARSELILRGDIEDSIPVNDENDYASLYRRLAAIGYVPDTDYRDRARQAAGQMLATLLRRVRDGLAAGLAGVQQAFTTWGYRVKGPHGPWALRSATVELVNAGYQAGYTQGLSRDEMSQRIFGLQYVAIRDERTSDICNAYDHVKLPASHPWWLSHWPSNHNHCRSEIIPIMVPSFTPTPESDIPYAPPPAPGFGRAPDAAFGFRFRAMRVGLFGQRVA